MTGITDDFFEDVAEDFYAESDEILTSIRKNLLLIDDLKGLSHPEKAMFEELLRSCHTLKGLTAMVGAKEISNLTHILENYLKFVSEANLIVTPEALDIVFSAVTLLQQQLAAFRNKTDMPDASSVIADLKKLMPEDENTKDHGSLEKEEIKQDFKINAGEKIWKINFKPDHELFDRGVNINTVRNKLQEAGRIISSVPKTGTDGRIAFEFIIASAASISLFESWTNDGMTFEQVQTDTTPESENKVSVEHTVQKTNTSDADQLIMSSKNIVRVDLKRLEDIMQIIGDMVITRLRLDDHLHKLTITDKDETRSLFENAGLLERQLRDLRNGIMKLRLVPVSEAFERMKFVIRDLIRESKKSILLEMEGQDIQIDKYIMEKMFDSLLHLVRNAVSHGIESKEDRASKGKSLTGRILLKASSSGDTVKFEIEDDGRGIDRARIMQKAIESGFATSDDEPDDDTILNIITASGFTTRNETDMVSGRGVGLDVVSKNLAELGGTIKFASETGKYTRFVIRLPLTLSIVDALIVSAGKNVFAVPMPFINEVIRVTPQEIVKSGDNELIQYREAVLPLLRLSRFFRLGEDGNHVLETMITGNGAEMAGIATDKILGKREIVVRSLTDPLIKVEGISGATELGEGKVILIIDPASLVNSAIKRNKTKNKISEVVHNG
jgi:two-component system chemotaxis sensor kinase CheA